MINKYKQINKVLWVILFANILVAATKLILGTILQINSLTADGFHSFTDSTSNIIGLIGVAFASKPADREHPYGHNKFETIASLVIGFMLFFIAGRIVYSSIRWFISPVTPRVTIISIISLLITVLINIGVAVYEYKKGMELDSDVLIADSIHTRSDILISAGVFVTLIGIRLGLPTIVDPILSLVIALFVFHASYEILKKTIAVLVDRRVIDHDRVEEIVLSYDDVLNVHNIRSRGRSDRIFVDLHIVTNPKLTVMEAHDLSHDIEEALQNQINKNIEFIAHVEPNSKESQDDDNK